MKHSDPITEQTLEKLARSTRSPRGKYSARESYRMLEQRIGMRRTRHWLRIASSVAAVVAFCALSYGIYLYTAPVEIVTASTLAQTRTIQLPDGTEVTLNRYTSLSYPKKFKGEKREVQLSGEAYFDVTKDKSRPFIVQAETVEVEVLGTRFNVEAYPNDELIKTTLFEGSVAMSTPHEAERIILKPQQSATYDKRAKNRLEAEEEENAGDELAWKSGGLIFSNLPLKEICRQLSNTFAVPIRIESPELGEYRMSGRFLDGENLEQILFLLQTAGNFDHTFHGKAITITSKSE